jgi:hypothetical protein
MASVPISDFKTNESREDYIFEAANDYVATMENIADSLTAEGGADLGEVVKQNLALTHAESEYMIKTGLPKKVTNAVKDAAGEIKKQGG